MTTRLITPLLCLLAGSALGQDYAGGRIYVSRAYIRSSSGYYLTAENGGGLTAPGAFSADRRQPGPWETFKLVGGYGEYVYAIQTVTGHFLTAEGGGPGGLASDRRAVGPWEKFTMEILSRGCAGEVAFRTAGGTYLTFEGNGGQRGPTGVATNRTRVGPWERFVIVRPDVTCVETPAPPPSAEVTRTQPPPPPQPTRPGWEVAFFNNGGFNSKFSVYYMLNGVQQTDSLVLGPGQAASYFTPPGTTSAVAVGECIACRDRDMFNTHANRTPRSCFAVSGTPQQTSLNMDCTLIASDPAGNRAAGWGRVRQLVQAPPPDRGRQAIAEAIQFGRNSAQERAEFSQGCAPQTIRHSKPGWKVYMQVSLPAMQHNQIIAYGEGKFSRDFISSFQSGGHQYVWWPAHSYRCNNSNIEYQGGAPQFGSTYAGNANNTQPGMEVGPR